MIPSCTELISRDIRSGEIDEHGNYSGVVGMIQRKEIDYGLVWMRSDCLATESLNVLATIAGADVRIVSPKLNYSATESSGAEYKAAADRFEPFLETCALVDQYSLYCVLAAIFTVALVISVDQRRSHPNSYAVSLSAKQYAHALWEVFKLIVRQGKLKYQTTLLRMIWFILTVGLFIIISGVFLNLLRTEQVAQRSPDQIDTLTDVIGSRFPSIQPTLVTNAFTYGLGKLKLKHDSDEKKLFDKLKRHDGNLVSIESTNTGGPYTIQASINRARESKDRYFLVEDVLWTKMKPVLCHCSPNGARQVRASPEPILGGLLITPLAKDVDFKLRKYLAYRLTNQFELGISNFELSFVFETLAQITSQWEPSQPNSTICLLGLPDEAPLSDMVFKLKHCKRILSFLASMLTLSLFVNFVEYLAAKRYAKNLPTTEQHQIKPMPTYTGATNVVDPKIAVLVTRSKPVPCHLHSRTRERDLSYRAQPIWE
ncbi:hypothetical protein HDE_00992 [Halotydeus destructor]|nr:hypothetical protein HDE_00992 [Halotydeus destructor]